MTIIFKNKDVLSVNYVPEKLVARESLVEDIISKLKKGKFKLLMVGQTGSGKTISVIKALENQDNFIIIDINCSEYSSYTSVVKQIIEKIKNKRYNELGKSRSQLTTDLIETLKTKRLKELIFCFDEIDRLVNKEGNHQEIFYHLLNNTDSSFILISNNIHALEKLDQRILSRLTPERKIIQSYNLNEIFNILKQRAELGLKETAYDNNTLIQIAKFSAEISGDVRFALRLLEETSNIAEALGETKITIEIIKKAIKKLEQTDFDDVYLSLPLHLKLVVVAIANISKINVEEYAITYPNVYDFYIFLVKQHRAEAVGERRFRDFLNTLEMLDIISLVYRTPKNRRGRLRVAIPKFDVYKFLEKYYTRITE